MLKSLNWVRWVGDAIVSVAILLLASAFAGAFDIFANVENGVQVAGTFGLAVFFGMPFLMQLTPSALRRFVSVVSGDDPPLKDLLFGLSSPVVILILWSVLVW